MHEPKEYTRPSIADGGNDTNELRRFFLIFLTKISFLLHST